MCSVCVGWGGRSLAASVRGVGYIHATEYFGSRPGRADPEKGLSLLSIYIVLCICSQIMSTQKVKAHLIRMLKGTERMLRNSKNYLKCTLQ